VVEGVKGVALSEKYNVKVNGSWLHSHLLDLFSSSHIFLNDNNSTNYLEPEGTYPLFQIMKHLWI